VEVWKVAIVFSSICDEAKEKEREREKKRAKKERAKENSES
jgi:hypothetical protein